MVLVLPNLYNVLAIEPELHTEFFGQYITQQGVGAHELIIDHAYADHRHTADLPLRELALIVEAARLRMLDLVKDTRFRCPVLFKNYKPEAGASQGHPHHQLWALPVVPRRIETMLKNAKRFYRKEKVCLQCKIIQDEIGATKRLIFSNEFFVVWAPFAPRFAFEITIAPRFHAHRFEWMSAEQTWEFVKVLKTVWTAHRVVTEDAPMNMVLITAPWFENDPRPSYGKTVDRDFHWSLQFNPRVNKLAGFELQTGFYVHSIPPEETARRMLEVL